MKFQKRELCTTLDLAALFLVNENIMTHDRDSSPNCIFHIFFKDISTPVGVLPSHKSRRALSLISRSRNLCPGWPLQAVEDEEVHLERGEGRREEGEGRGTMVSPQGGQSSDGHYQSSYGRRQTTAYTDDDHNRLQVWTIKLLAWTVHKPLPLNWGFLIYLQKFGSSPLHPNVIKLTGYQMHQIKTHVLCIRNLQ